jgi:hypothetical protein
LYLYMQFFGYEFETFNLSLDFIIVDHTSALRF